MYWGFDPVAALLAQNSLLQPLNTDNFDGVDGSCWRLYLRVRVSCYPDQHRLMRICCTPRRVSPHVFRIGGPIVLVIVISF